VLDQLALADFIAPGDLERRLRRMRLRYRQRRDALVEALSWHRLVTGGPPGLVLGFANLSRGVIERGVAELRRALEMAV
jgi:aspartate/methionine/tyrosine aminotransferase